MIDQDPCLEDAARRRDRDQRQRAAAAHSVHESGERSKHLAALGLEHLQHLASANITKADISRAYRKAALRYHPDRALSGGKLGKDLATEKFVVGEGTSSGGGTREGSPNFSQHSPVRRLIVLLLLLNYTYVFSLVFFFPMTCEYFWTL